ncbi:CLUMA_CG008354, isoform A, partial [Clunio marinus]
MSKKLWITLLVGWIEDFYSESTEAIVNAYIKRKDHNIIVIDWGQYSFGEYFSVIPRFTQISKMIAKLLIDMFERGLDINQIHCVGHSFGSHIMGIIGRELQRNSFNKYKLKRISALDAAHFGFWPPLLESPIMPSDAVFVDAIHSDVNFIGTRNRVGHVDFYPNDGQLQPGCPAFRFTSFMDIVNSFCSHQHAWRYWADSVLPGQERIFPALYCRNYRDFKNGKCNENQINFMGFGVDARKPGVFFNELKSNRNYTVDDSYYMYLASSLNYRSDL